jgi:hypothetical protein
MKTLAALLAIIVAAVAVGVYLHRTNEQSRIEKEKLRARIAALESEQRPHPQTAPAPGSIAPRPSFQFPFLSRSTWTNAGLATPMAVLETFFWAFTTGNEAALDNASARDGDDRPIRLTGMALNFAEGLRGAQVLQLTIPDPNNLDAVRALVVYERVSQQSDQNGLPFEHVGHGVLEIHLQKANGEWRFAGKGR